MSLQQDVRQYVRVARKSNQCLLSFDEFNSKHGTKLPVDTEAQEVFTKFTKSLKRARASHGVPVQSRLFNIYSALQKNQSPTVNVQSKRAFVPEPTQTLSPTSSRSLQAPVKKAKIEKAKIVEEYTVDHFKNDLDDWKRANPQSKLNNETQVVYFVPGERVDNFEHFATKLTKSTGTILETGGMFKMRSGLKKEILGMEQDEATNILDMVKKGVKGPYFLPMACPTGATECKC